jgi:hypothetical protein
VILGAAFCPHPPAVIPALAQGAAGDFEPMRTACEQVITHLHATGPDQLVIIGTGSESRLFSPLARGSLAGYGVPVEAQLGAPGCGGPADLPLSLVIGGWLTSRALGPRNGAIGVSVGPGFAASRVAADLVGLATDRLLALVVMGDGTARRSRAAPGHLDERAAAFDAVVRVALRAGDGATLNQLDAELGTALLAAGTAAWIAAGGLLAGADYDAQLRYDDAPYGVQYFVASWLTRA